MKRLYIVIYLNLLCILAPCHIFAQKIRVEGFVGNTSSVVDVFWLKPFVKESPFLYLSRNTYRIPNLDSAQGNFSTLHIGAYQFGKTGLGLALAATATTNSAMQARAGIQFLKAKPQKWLFYTIFSTKLGSDSDARWLAIGQITPRLRKNLDAFVRGEWITSIGFGDSHRFSANILRVGLQWKQWQFGPGTDLIWTGSRFEQQSSNYGFFLTHLF